MGKEFQKGREYERARESMRFHLWMGYGSIIYLAFFVFVSIFNHSIDNVGTMVVLLLFGMCSLYLGHSKKKELDTKETKKINGWRKR